MNMPYCFERSALWTTELEASRERQATATTSTQVDERNGEGDAEAVDAQKP